MDPSPMEVEQFTAAQAFRAAADPLLLLDEARNNLILGVTQVVIDQPGLTTSFVAGWCTSRTAWLALPRRHRRTT